MESMQDDQQFSVGLNEKIAIHNNKRNLCSGEENRNSKRQKLDIDLNKSDQKFHLVQTKFVRTTCQQSSPATRITNGNEIIACSLRERRLQHTSRGYCRLLKCLVFLHIMQHMASPNIFHFIFPPRIHQSLSSSMFALAIDFVPSIRDEAVIHFTSHVDSLLDKDHTYQGQTIKPIDFINHKETTDQNLIHQAHHHKHNHNHHHQYHRPINQANSIAGGHKHPASGRGRKRRHGRANDQFLDVASSSADRPVVMTKKGPVRGITQKAVTGKYVDSFLGIPYAQPPSGRYRFRHPQPINSWRDELDASRLPNSCYQLNDTFFGANFMGTSVWNANTPLDEDCLYLNVWTPFGAANTTTPSSVNSRGYSAKLSGRQTASSKTTRKSVLVWIFGGGFTTGSSSLALYEGGALASEEDIIVVSMNYRVAAFGFLYFGRPDAPGNAGLFDQLMALQWINDNIDQFGGDPQRVTIFGESAGAVSVAFHLLSPLSRNLFNQAILQSGAPTCPWGFMESHEIIKNGLQLASRLNCPSNKSDLDAVVECLLTKDPIELVSQDIDQGRSLLNYPFVPVVDGSFLLEHPAESMAKSNFKQARVLLGSNYDEGSAFLIYLPEFSNCPSSTNSGSGHIAYGKPHGQTNSGDVARIQQASSRSNPPPASLNSETKDFFPLTTPSRETITHDSQRQSTGQQRMNNSNLQPNHPEHQQKIAPKSGCKPIDYLTLSREDFLHILHEGINPYAVNPISKEAIVFEYTNWNNPQNSAFNYDALDEIVGDYYFTCHVNDFAHQYAQAGNPVYMYYFKQRSSISVWPKWMGVLHGDEISFVFGEPLNQMLNYTAREVELSRRMMRYWANFAKFGNPNEIGENSTDKWPEYSEDRRYMELHSDYIRIDRGPRAKQCAFWSEYLPKLLQSFENIDCSKPHSTGLSNIHPPGYLRPDQKLSSIPSALIFGLVVILVLVAVGGLVAILTRRSSWKFNLWLGTSTEADPEDGTSETNRRGQSSLGRWRNQRAAASHQRAQAAAAASGTPAATTGFASGSGPPINASGSPQAKSTQQTFASIAQTTTSTSGLQLQHKTVLGSGVPLHNMRPQLQQSTPAGNGSGQKYPLAQQSTAPESEQSAFDIAQSAAARVTATGSAAAAMAVARFKMLRSNTLGAAFGRAETNAEVYSAVDSTPGNLLALRTRDDRIVNKLSTSPKPK